ncbi:uncharacterized protein STEHIDRAFT_172513 [Stereum hirsutum FP-91666 SS1]|uniref:uncharacterized protein n=1 Tax=Stereum hirsutum (strain FP-91666) TaxID=721885 RepID=UPI000444A8C3|nr:uncharacterized protein STEHIDRAFT_172513 [Stereum hirsutum FP-91666 SS1]EIM80825.1 hypothetical protein STEHIDRAFT_172513 [Stereum hirsutum FP-91666 SS1]
MRVVSILHPRNGTNGADFAVNESGEVLVLKYQGEAILSEVPETFVDLEETCRDTFSLPKAATLIFETSDLNICQGQPVKIMRGAWAAIRLVVGAVTVSIKGDRQRVHDEGRVSFLPFTEVRVEETEYSHSLSTSKHGIPAGSARKPHPRTYHGTPQENDAAPILPPTSPLAGKSPAPLRNTLQPHRGFNPDDNDDAGEDDDDRVNATLDDFEDDEDENEPPVRSPVKGKGKTPIQRQILSDDEEENDENERPASDVYVDSISSARKPRVSVGHRTVPQQETVNDIFSPKANKTARTRVPLTTSPDSDDDGGRGTKGSESTGGRGSSDTYEFVMSPRETKRVAKNAEDLFMDDGDLDNQENAGRKSATPRRTPVSQKKPSSRINREDEHIAASLFKPATSKFKPAQTSSSHASDRDDTSQAPTESSQTTVVSGPEDKLLITISYPPGEQSSKFKVKGKHNVGKVLQSACNAFGLDYNSAHLYLQDGLEDGVEMTYECKKSDTLAGSGVGQGAAFIIALDDDEE